ncbi:MAG: SDR family oxidoreductase [Gemmatimonadaceae bacterium]|nr:SDR family oxidoreductase [Chitinophagaceae bacterium]
MQKSNPKKLLRKPQHQDRPGQESRMSPQPVAENTAVKGSGKLSGKTALITGGDSGIGRAVAVLFAKEGANVAISYLNEHKDAKDTCKMVEEFGRECLLLPGDISKESVCKSIVQKTVKKFKQIDILVNNAAIHYETKSITDISTKNLRKTFETNIFSMFWITKYAMPSIRKGGSIINTSSVTAYRGSADLLDYSATKGAIVSFTRSLAASLSEKGIRVNGVAPGPIWTPLIVSSFKPAKVAKHGSDVPLKRAGEPSEVAPSYLFLACSDSSYITGQFLHPNGGEIVGG